VKNTEDMVYERMYQEGSRLRNDLYCVEWGVKLYSLTHQEGSREKTGWDIEGEEKWGLVSH